MINNKELFLYEYLKLCNEYFSKRDKALLTEINDMYSRDLNTKLFIFNSQPNEARCYSGRINFECAEDLSTLEEGDTFRFSKIDKSPVRVWCKDKDKLKRHIEHKLFSKKGNKAVIVSELINKKNILFDYDNYNLMVESGKLFESFTGNLKESAKEFKPLKIDNTVKEVLVSSDVNKAEVLEVLTPFEDFNSQKIIDEIKKSFNF